MVRRHLNNKHLLLADAGNPESTEDMTVLDFEVMSGRPCLRRVAEGSDHSKAVVAKKLSFLAEAKPAEFRGGRYCAISVEEHSIVSS